MPSQDDIDKVIDFLGWNTTRLNRDGEPVSFKEWNHACNEYLAMEGLSDPYGKDAARAMELHEAACQYADAKYNIDSNE